ncbi:MAG: hypothetical protein KGL39_54635 [Patescibacteria group bacterium]|nr:hypothetical protein [Patescibacteria group bacterium]
MRGSITRADVPTMRAAANPTDSERSTLVHALTMATFIGKRAADVAASSTYKRIENHTQAIERPLRRIAGAYSDQDIRAIPAAIPR